VFAGLQPGGNQLTDTSGHPDLPEKLKMLYRYCRYLN
jgi:hypothetical protein